MIAHVTQFERRFVVGKAENAGWTVLDFKEFAILEQWFDTREEAQKVANKLEDEAK